MRNNAAAIIICLAVLSIGTAWATPVQFSGNNHWYEAVYVPGGITWYDARAKAESSGYYLATATSEVENQFIFSLINDPKYWVNGYGFSPLIHSFGPWLGGYSVGDVTKPESWRWVTGETWAFTKWGTGEPNLQNEIAIQYFGNGLWNDRQPTWNNLYPNFGGYTVGYIMEKDALVSIPEPGTLILLGAALALIGLFLIKRRNNSELRPLAVTSK